MTRARRRLADPASCARLEAAGFDAVLARILAARGVRDPDDVATDRARLLRPEAMLGLSRAASLLADAIDAQRAICVVGDYDCDGATATALMVLGLRRFGARVDFLVPNRLTDGYGLSSAVASVACHHPRLGRSDCIVTVDNGIASLAGVDTARKAGMQVIITDHHLPGPQLPAADAIVNPNQVGCQFASPHLAGVGVAFYVVAAVRAELLSRGRWAGQPPRLDDLLDLVALGTVADLVVMDSNNRRLVAGGLARMRTGRARPGLSALMQISRCTTARMSERDLGFALAPRINAAGRLEDITIGIECLLADSLEEGLVLASRLDSINQARKTIEADMRSLALAAMPEPAPTQRAVVVAHDDWHEGVIGLVASRLKDRWHRPVFALAPAQGEPGTLRGSGRSIAGVHLRDVLALIAARESDLIMRFGGHAMAAGLSLAATRLEQFGAAFEQAVGELGDTEAFDKALLTDGPLPADRIDLPLAHLLETQIWGQGFATPLFCNQFEVLNQRTVGSGHLKLRLRLDDRILEAIWFNRTEPLAGSARLAYRLQSQEYRGRTELQLQIEDEVTDE